VRWIFFSMWAIAVILLVGGTLYLILTERKGSENGNGRT